MTTPRWYRVNKDGMATLCADREDAEKEAKDANMAWPHTAPHRAVQLVEVADVEALRTGYAAARLEIESLQARIKTMAEEHADELMVAHLDGRMRAAQQPAPSAAVASKAVLAAIRAANMQLVRTGDDEFMLVTLKQATPQADTQPAPQHEAQEPVAWYVTGCGRLLDEYEAEAEARRIGGTAKAMPLYTVPQPSPASQGDALDAARYRYLRDGDWREHEKLESVIRLQLNTLWDETIDAARAAQDGGDVAMTTTAAPAQAADSVLEDAARLDWLLLHISGAEFRRIGVHYSGNARRADVDAARKQGGAT